MGEWVEKPRWGQTMQGTDGFRQGGHGLHTPQKAVQMGKQVVRVPFGGHH